MSKKRRKQQSKNTTPVQELEDQQETAVEQVAAAETPETEAEAEAKAETPEAEAEAKAETEKPEGGEPDEKDSLEAILNALPDEMRAKALEQVKKLREQAFRAEGSKKWVEFDKALKNEADGLPKFIGDLAEKHGVDLTGRRVVITYPAGKFNYSNSPKGSSSSSSNRTGFPTSWGEATYEGNTHKSPSALATSLGLQITGHRDMIDVFQSQGYEVEAEKGKFFRVTKK